MKFFYGLLLMGVLFSGCLELSHKPLPFSSTYENSHQSVEKIKNSNFFENTMALIKLGKLCEDFFLFDKNDSSYHIYLKKTLDGYTYCSIEAMTSYDQHVEIFRVYSNGFWYIFYVKITNN